MAWSEVDIPAAEQALFENDKPFILAQNLLRNATPTWVDGSATNAFNATFPPVRVHDGYTDLATRPTDLTSATYYLRFDLGALREFDTVAFPRHLVGGYDVSLEVADNSGYSTNLTVVHPAITVPANGGRFIMTNLTSTTGRKVITARYVRIKIVKASGTQVPNLFEVCLGKRIQLAHNPDVPYDPDAQAPSLATAVSYSGRRTNYIRHGRQRFIRGALTTSGAEAAAIIAGYEDAQGNARPVVYSPNPFTLASSYLFGFMATEFDMPYAGPIDRRYSIDFEEQGPHFLSEEA
jgi:hypothetical protein